MHKASSSPNELNYLVNTMSAEVMVILNRIINVSANQYHVCWWDGDRRNQGISRHDIDLFHTENFIAYSGGVNL